MQSRVKQKIGVLKVYAGSLDVCNRFLWIHARHGPLSAAAVARMKGGRRARADRRHDMDDGSRSLWKSSEPESHAPQDRPWGRRRGQVEDECFQAVLFGALDEGGGGWRPAEQVLTGFQLPIGGVVGQGFGKPEGGLPFGVNG